MNGPKSNNYNNKTYYKNSLMKVNFNINTLKLHILGIVKLLHKKVMDKL